MATHRVSHEPAFVLHRYDWSESSLILEVFTRHHGRIALYLVYSFVTLLLLLVLVT